MGARSSTTTYRCADAGVLGSVWSTHARWVPFHAAAHAALYTDDGRIIAPLIDPLETPRLMRL